jgi:hypothetical protein
MVRYATNRRHAANPRRRCGSATEAIPLLLALPIIALVALRTTSPLKAGGMRERILTFTACALIIGIGSVAWWAHRPSLYGHDHVVAERAAPFAGTMTTLINEQHAQSDLNELRGDLGNEGARNGP